MQEFICGTCGRDHATWEHRIYEKLVLAEQGVPVERLFVMPQEGTGHPEVDKHLQEIREALD